MSANVVTTLDPNVAKLLADGVAPTVLAAMCRAMDEQNELTLGAAQARRMSFPKSGPTTPEGLRVITNRLRSSLNRAPARVVGDGVLGAIGSNVRYYGVHEFGFEGSVNVRAHQRRTPVRFTLAGATKSLSRREAASQGLLTKAGQARKALPITTTGGGTTLVKAHTMKVRMPARRMVQRTADERAEQYRAAFTAAIEATVGDQGGAA